MKRLRTVNPEPSNLTHLRSLRYVVRAFALLLEENTSVYDMIEEEVQACPEVFFQPEYAINLTELKRLVNTLTDELTDQIESERAARSARE
jgi:transcription initiation factor IIE alpha subunit